MLILVLANVGDTSVRCKKWETVELIAIHYSV